MSKERILITLVRELKDDIEKRRKEEEFNFSHWVETTYIKENMTENGLKLRADFHKKQAKFAENRLTYLKRNAKNSLNLYLKKLNKLQISELQKTKRLINKNPRLLEGRLRLWNNELRFAMKSNLDKISKPEFINLMGSV